MDYGDRTRIFNDAATTLASLPPSSPLAHLHLTIIAWISHDERHPTRFITDNNWNPFVATLSRFDNLTSVELVVVPFLRDSHLFVKPKHDHTLVEFFSRDVDRLFPSTRRYTVNVIIEDEQS